MSVKITANGIDTIQDNTVHSTKIVDNGIHADDLPSGSLLQILERKDNHDYGTIGNSSPWHLSTMDITLTTKSDNSTFLISAQYASDDTNSNNFGVGIGVYVTGATITDEYWLYPAAHEDYTSGGLDTYFVAKHTTAFSPGYPKNTVFTIRVYGRYNNSNGHSFMGNGGTYYSNRHIVQEFKG